MPEIFKLTGLPPQQRRRKVLRILEYAEYSVLQNRHDEFLDVFYLRLLLKTVLEDVEPSAAKKIQSWIDNPSETEKRRIINFTRYELYKATGANPSEWDLILPDAPPDELSAYRRQFFKDVYVYAEDIRTPFNIGSVFRTAESFGAEKIFLSPGCVSPENPKAKRTAMGCTDYLPWERRELHELPNVPVIALETGGCDIGRFEFPKTGTVIIGSEELGISPEALKKADCVVTIPMYGIKASINVSVAFGIFIQRWCETLAQKNRITPAADNSPQN